MALILIIDDDPDILEASTLILKSRGFDVKTAQEPISGYKVIEEDHPDLIILDVMMNEPDDGFFLAQKIRRAGITTPVLMYTSVSKALGQKYEAGELIPVDEFIEKPLSADELVKRVEKYVHSPISR